MLDGTYGAESQQYLYHLGASEDRIIGVQSDAYGDGVLRVRGHDRSGSIALYPTGHIVPGAGSIEWEALIADLRDLPGTQRPHYPAAPVDRGIENRFVGLCIHFGAHPASSPVAEVNPVR